MTDVKIISADGERIRLSAGIPAKYKLQGMAGAVAQCAQCSFGDILLWNVKGEGFEIQKMVFIISKDTSVKYSADKPLLALFFMMEGSIDTDWKNLVKGNIQNKQVDLFYSPGVDLTIHFQAGKQYTVVRIHFTAQMLRLYADGFPLLDNFLEKMRTLQPARLFNNVQFVSPRMDNLLGEMISYSFIDSIAHRYYNSCVHILLFLLLEKLTGLKDGDAKKYKPADIEIAYEAKRLLTVERINTRDQAYTISMLCRKLGTNSYKLKTSFKYLFGIPVGQYKKQVFMEYAKSMLVESNQTQEQIAMQLGYGSQQSFITAFKTYFGYTPGYLRRKML